MSLRRPVALAAAASLALAGCGLRDRIQPTTTGTSTPDPGSSQGSEGEDLGTLTGSGRPLDEGGLRAALPSADEVGDGWGEDPVTTVTETQSADVTPATCAPLLQKGPGWDSVRATQRARVQTNLRRTDNPQPPGTERHHMGVWAYSFDDPYPSQLFDEAGQTITDCAGFDVKQRDTGNTSSYEAEPLAFVVSELNIKYLKPARIDDALVVRTLYEAVKGPRLLIRQNVERGREVLCRAEVTAVCIHLDGRPRRPTRALVDKVSPWLAPAG